MIRWSVCVVLIALFSAHDAGADELDEIQRMIETGLVGEASVNLMNYRRAHPDDPRALLYRARLADDPHQARALLREVELLALRGAEPDSAIAAEAVYATAELHLAAGDTDAAADDCERLLNEYPMSDPVPRALYRLGMIALERGDADGALARFDACLERAETGDIRALAATGRMECYVRVEQWRDALDAAHAVLEEDDEDSAVTPRVLEVMAESWRELGNAENAARFTDRLLETYPQSIQAHAAREAGKKLAAESALPEGSRQPGERVITATDNSASAVPDDTASSAADNRQATAGPAFAVQASAFSDRANAYRMYRDLREKGFDAGIDMRTVDEQHFYKVLVGRYSSREEAERMVNSVSAATGVRAIVVILE